MRSERPLLICPRPLLQMFPNRGDRQLNGGPVKVFKPCLVKEIAVTCECHGGGHMWMKNMLTLAGGTIFHLLFCRFHLSRRSVAGTFQDTLALRGEQEEEKYFELRRSDNTVTPQYHVVIMGFIHIIRTLSTTRENFVARCMMWGRKNKKTRLRRQVPESEIEARV